MKEEILAKHKKRDAKRGDEPPSKKKKKKVNTMNEGLGRQALRSNPQNKRSYLHSTAMNLYTF